MADEVVIAFGFDDRYTPHAAATIASIVANAPGARLHFLVAHDGVPQARQAKLATVAPEARFTWLQVDAGKLPAYAARDYTKHINVATLYRLQLDALAPEGIDRVVYLDVDLVVLGDVRELWKAELGDAAVGAIPDPFVSVGDYIAAHGVTPGGLGYFNAGVLVLDLDRIRAEGGFAQALRFMVEKDPLFADQDALNFQFWQRWRRLDGAWNVQAPTAISASRGAASEEWRSAASAPRAVHFTGGDKPWLPKAYHPWGWLYWRYQARTPFLGEVMRGYGFGPVDLARVWLRYQRRRPRAYEGANASH